MRISDWSSDVCSSDLRVGSFRLTGQRRRYNSRFNIVRRLLRGRRESAQMIRSMTGYARVEASFAWGRLSWELRSVNHRYFDVSFKVPEEFRVLEGELRQAAGGTISRGKVECGLRYARENSGRDSNALNALRLATITDALDAVAAELGASSE